MLELAESSGDCDVRLEALRRCTSERYLSGSLSSKSSEGDVLQCCIWF
jgi:hypothetical protein